MEFLCCYQNILKQTRQKKRDDCFIIFKSTLFHLVHSASSSTISSFPELSAKPKEHIWRKRHVCSRGGCCAQEGPVLASDAGQVGAMLSTVVAPGTCPLRYMFIDGFSPAAILPSYTRAMVHVAGPLCSLHIPLGDVNKRWQCGQIP